MNTYILARGCTFGVGVTVALALVAWATLGAEAASLIFFSLPGAALMCTFLAGYAARAEARLWKLLAASVVAAFVNGPLAGTLLVWWTTYTTGYPYSKFFHFALYGTIVLAPAILLAGLVVGGLLWARVRP